MTLTIVPEHGVKLASFYMAARYSRQAEMQAYATTLRSLGYEVTSRWIEGDHRTDDADLEAPTEEDVRFAEEDLQDIIRADQMIYFSEPLRTPTRGGRHVEFGVAIILGLPISVIGPRENIFHVLEDVVHYRDWDEFVQDYLLVVPA